MIVKWSMRLLPGWACYSFTHSFSFSFPFFFCFFLLFFSFCFFFYFCFFLFFFFFSFRDPPRGPHVLPSNGVTGSSIKCTPAWQICWQMIYCKIEMGKSKMSELVIGSVSERVDGSVSEWVSEWVNEWASMFWRLILRQNHDGFAAWWFTAK